MSATAGPGWRLVEAHSGDAASHMATDEILLHRVAAGEAPATLRFYQFSPAALSLGRHQRVGEGCDASWCTRHGVDLVRRPTGGGAVLHEPDSITWSLVAPLGVPCLGSSVADVSCALSRVLQAAFQALGIGADVAGRGGAALPRRGAAPPVPGERPGSGGERGTPGARACFAVPARDEILWRGRKLAGTAQMRRRRAVLQQGTVPLTADLERQRGATGDPRLTLVSLARAAGRGLSAAEVFAALRESFERLVPGGLVPGALTVEERVEAERRRASRYLDAAWTFEGRSRQEADP